ncbi:MAG: DUF5829 family protein [Gemmatimonadota bacterium]
MRSLLTRASCALIFLSSLPAVPGGDAPAVGLNHLAIVADSATFEAIAASPFLRDTFALFEPNQREPNRVALVGHSTYVEFRLAASAREAWTSTLALGTDVPGALKAVARRLTSEVGRVQLDTVRLRRDSAEVPWLYQLALSDARTDSTLAVRVLEYHPSFLRHWYGSPKAPLSVARSDVLAMRATGGAPERRFQFRDVVAVKVAAERDAAARLVEHCRGLGWRVQPATGGTACVGPGVRLFVVPPERHERGIVAFTMRVAPTGKVRGPTTRAFGRSVLRVSRTGFATWEFTPRLR